jgi:hypothetical protein
MFVKSALLVNVRLIARSKYKYAAPETAVVFVLLSTLLTYMLRTLLASVAVNTAPAEYVVSTPSVPALPPNVLIFPVLVEVYSMLAIVVGNAPTWGKALIKIAPESTVPPVITGIDVVNVNDENNGNMLHSSALPLSPDGNRADVVVNITEGVVVVK